MLQLTCGRGGREGKGREGSGGGDRGTDKRRRECHGIRPSDSSEASVQRSAGALKLKPPPEHNSWRGPQEADVSSRAGYWPL